MKSIRVKKILPLVAIVTALCAAGLPRMGGLPVVFAHNGRNAAAASSKISVDLKDKTGKGERVSVIIQTPDEPSAELSDEVGRKGGNVKGKYNHVGALAVDVPGDSLATLASRSDVSYISLDRPVEQTGHLEVTTGASLVRNYSTPTTGTIDGRDIGIAVLDSGINENHHAFMDMRSTSRKTKSRVVASVDLCRTEPSRSTNDTYGHGTHVAAIAAGNEHIAGGAYTGIAPAANIVNVKVLDSNGSGTTSDTLAGIDWVIKNRAAYNIRVMNLSLGAVAVDSYKVDPLCKAAARAWRAGIVVIAAAGNSGKDASGRKVYGAIHSPGIEPSVITVGAANTFGTDARDDDRVASFSSRGPTRGYSVDTVGGKRHYDNIIKPDLVAPGNRIIAAESNGCALVMQNPQLDATTSSTAYKSYHNMMQLSGTSMASPAVAGAAALMLQRNPSLTPNLVKAVLEYTAQPLAGFNTLEQGAGLLNVEGAVRLAGLIRPDIGVLRLVGAPMLLTGALPLQKTTIAGWGFTWGGGLVQNWNVISGPNLMLKYQGIYDTSVMMSDGVTISEGSLLTDGSLLSDGITLSDGALLADGTTLASGSLFVSGITISEGVLLTDGTMMADGGKMMSDSAINGTNSLMSTGQSVLVEGDPGMCMMAAPDDTNW